VINHVPTYGLQRSDILCLSGGGYRAALFHLGALTRLNELGLLAQAGTVGGVAGGSILAALLATKVPWPLQGVFTEWSEAVAEPLRAIAHGNLYAQLRGPISGSVEGALEERYARELASATEVRGEGQPRFVFGAAGLTLGEMTGGGERERRGLRWEIGNSTLGGYSPTLVADMIAAMRTDLTALNEAEQAVLENHGYTLADAAVRSGKRPEGTAAIEPPPAEPPHPDWMDGRRMREALTKNSGWNRLGWLRPLHQR
jgi:hypothetical protein